MAPRCRYWEETITSGKIIDAQTLDKARKRNAYVQYWPGDSIPIIADESLIYSLRNKETGVFSKESLYLYQTNFNNSVSAEMASFVLAMGEYDDVGVVSGLKQILNGAEYVDITGIVRNSTVAVGRHYASYTGFNFGEAAEMEDTLLLERMALSIMDETSRTVSSAFNDKLPTFMQDKAFNEVVLMVASAGYGGSAKFVSKFKTKSPEVAQIHKGSDIPYSSRDIRNTLVDANGPDNVTSTTVPPSNGKNVKLAGQRHPVTGIVFDDKGYPIFDDIATFDTRLPIDKFREASYTGQMQMATNDLAEAIQKGQVSAAKFSTDQLKQINSGRAVIDGFTWHHHQDTDRMQLIYRDIHKRTGHIGWEAMSNGK